MPKNLVFAVIAVLLLFTPANHSNAQAKRPDPALLSMRMIQMDQFTQAESVVNELVSNNPRTADGRYELFLYVGAMREWFEMQGEEFDSKWRNTFKRWETEIPDSPLVPIFRAMQMNASAWKARGHGFNSTVSEEGRLLFSERAERAWLMIKDAKARSDKLPIWYEAAITFGADAGLTNEVLRPLFEEGIGKFPGYHGIYFAYTRELTPLWGGEYADAAKFIKKQVAASSNLEGEVLYARLFWLVDQYQNQPMEFFAESGVEWPKMRSGFERLMRDYPESRWNHANFAAFACRAGDNQTFRQLRKQLDTDQFEAAVPPWLSLDICEVQAK